MMRRWRCPKTEPPAMTRQWTRCGQVSGQFVSESGQKTGIPLLWHFFVHSTALTRITTGPFGVDSPVRCEHPCPHFCGQGVDTRVDILSPAHVHRKGACIWYLAP